MIFFNQKEGGMKYGLNFSGAVVLLSLITTGFAGGIPEKMPYAPMVTEASDAGIYLGLNAGGGFTNWKDCDGNDFGDPDGGSVKSVGGDNGLVGRAFLGYDINKYFATEVGYSYFFNKPNVAMTDRSGKSAVVSSGDIKTQAFDLYGKGKLPVFDTVDLYTKVGIGYLMSNQGEWGKFNNTNLAFGIGADYKFTRNFIINIEWSRIAGYSSMNNKYIPNTYAAMAGLRYKFNT